MTLSRLVFRSMRKNVKHYYLYFFALIFSVTLCFSFTTLQYNPTVEAALKESGTATAGFSAGSYTLYFIITFFVLYANHLFMKRRSKEFGLYQLVGMTKGLVIRLIALENIILFVLAVGIGMGIGYFSSRLFAMVLLKMLEIDLVVKLSFSQEAFNQSVLIFGILLVVILIQMVWMIRKVSLLSLFTASNKTDERVKRFSVFHMMMGLVGIILIIFGYYQSTLLFNVEKNKIFNDLYVHMMVILGSTILGTFLVFRYSVALIMNALRSSRNGHLKVTDVLAVTPILHRMKSNAKSLTLITLLTGLAVGIMSLSYIAYYSSDKHARQETPYDYILLNDLGLGFLDALEREGIGYEKHSFRMGMVELNIKDLLDESLKDSTVFNFNEGSPTNVISISEFRQVESNVMLKEGEAFITGYDSMLEEVLSLNAERDIFVHSGDTEIPLYITEIRDENIFPHRVLLGTPVLVVTDQLFENVLNTENEEREFFSQVGINLVDKDDLAIAEVLYQQYESERGVVFEGFEDYPYVQPSYEETRKGSLATLGLTIFVTAFLGLAFLLTTGSILYFKQMAEAEDEKEFYTTLRKIGFSTSHIMKGIYAKQLFNFGVPLIIGLLHSYFAVKSGWFLFGTELVAPLVITMCLYVIMYGVFAVLSIQYYKQVVRSSL
ncbi:FtsX-like permease family protein [Lysinibacillus antri]|uniref:ABC transporter permease n=1 Tax=Lysinibacillus antri TaxID=2498145 RepID=A0A432LFK1_9BACI|nr:ABC transporter permease [Lysinibacillus antri]RUL54754.1 ABC transporter permease [Lysinibacillus antri]